MKTPNVRPHIHAHDVALLEHPFARDAVDDFIVDAVAALAG